MCETERICVISPHKRLVINGRLTMNLITKPRPLSPGRAEEKLILPFNVSDSNLIPFNNRI
jgi:hypothetical protein